MNAASLTTRGAHAARGLTLGLELGRTGAAAAMAAPRTQLVAGEEGGKTLRARDAVLRHDYRIPLQGRAGHCIEDGAMGALLEQ